MLLLCPRNGLSRHACLIGRACVALYLS